MVSIYNTAALETWRKEKRIEPLALRRMGGSFLRLFKGQEKALIEIPDAHRQAAQAQLQFHTLKLNQKRDSQLDGASKLLFHTHDERAIETVILRIASGRTTLCVSSQTACGAGCAFCATGRLKGLRNLSVDEVLDQVAQAGELLAHEKRSPRNVVFMGMGEPFHNEENLHQILSILLSNTGFNLSARHVLVSTVGISDAMLRLAEKFPQVGLALSLHSARQNVRNKIIPLSRRYPLTQLKETLQKINALQSRDVMIEYLMFDELTDTVDDLAALLEFLEGLKVHVNLIPYNTIGQTPQVEIEEGAIELRPSQPARFDAFLASLKQAGFKATRRYSLGADIAAACGQLARQRGADTLVR